MKRIGLLLAAVIGLTACGTMPGAPPPELDRTGWQAVQVAGRAPVAGSEPLVLFEDGKIAGYTGCNEYGGPYRIQDTSIAIGDLATTDVACPEPIGTQERLFMQALSSARGVRLDGERLVISGPGGELVLESIPAGEKGERTFGIVT